MEKGTKQDCSGARDSGNRSPRPLRGTAGCRSWIVTWTELFDGKFPSFHGNHSRCMNPCLQVLEDPNGELGSKVAAIFHELMHIRIIKRSQYSDEIDTI